MKIFLFVVAIVVLIALFLTSRENRIESGVGTTEETSKSERCPEREGDYTFSYADRLKQVIKGCF